jgi:hypothetical protein
MKSFEELELELPNGFHDAEIRGIALDYLARTAILSMNMLSGVGTPDNENLNIYRRATVRIAGLLLFFVEPPHPKYNFLLDGEPLSVSGDSVRAGQNSEMDCLLPALPQNSTVYRFFLDEWNSFVYLAAEGVEFLWDDQGSG